MEERDFELSRQVGAGSDVMGMFSIDEPGGLANQEFALMMVKHIVADRGGLKDFVKKGGTLKDLVVPGFELISSATDHQSHLKIQQGRMRSAHAILGAMKEELRLYHHDRDRYKREFETIQHFNPDWGERAKVYVDVYRSTDGSQPSAKSGTTALLALLGALAYVAMALLTGFLQNNTTLAIGGMTFFLSSAFLFGEEWLFMKRHVIQQMGSRDPSGVIWTYPGLSPFRANRVAWHERLVHAIPGGAWMDLLLAPILDPLAVLLAVAGVQGESRKTLHELNTGAKYLIAA